MLPGFRKRGYTFARNGEHTTALIHIQRSDTSTKDALIYTLNFGIVVNRLAEALELDVMKCSVWEAHWTERIDGILGVNDDTWWQVIDEETLKLNCENLENLIPNVALPWFEHWGTEDAMPNAWVIGRAAGLSDLLINKYLRILRA